MAEAPIEFGKRRPVIDPATSPPVKRSGHVALLVMGTMAVGGSSYAYMTRQNCQPNNPAMAALASPDTAAACASRTSWWSGGHSSSGGSGWWSRSSFYGGNSSSSGSSTSSGPTETTRGGFGGFARAISAHFSGS
jgi:uncharacterized membrane protein YgcG